MAEHSAVNRRVVGSSPTCGANLINNLRELKSSRFAFCDMDCDITFMSQVFEPLIHGFLPLF